MTSTLTGVALASITPSLTTTFAPTATACLENRLTMLANRGYQIWMNMPVPVAGTTLGDCYPSQYMTSYLLAAGGVTQPAFAPLVCPENWSTLGPFTSNYIACCPSGYSLANPTVSVKTDRPAYGGTCYSDLASGSTYLITQYGSSAVTQTTNFPITATDAQAYAYPIDGYAFGVAELGSAKTTTTSASNSASTSASSTSAAATTSGANPTYSVFISTEPTYLPSSLTAKVNDTIMFQFNSGNHSVTQSTFADPCNPLTGGFDSGFMVSTGNTTGTSPQASFKLLTTTPQFFYSKGAGDCSKGMVFVANPAGSETEDAFKAKAISMYGPKSHGVAIGVGVGVSVAAILAIAIGFFFWRRNKQRKVVAHSEVAGSDPDGYTAYDAQGDHIEPKTVASSQSEMDMVKVSDQPPPAFETHELHNYSQAYEMGGTTNHYEMDGSPQQQYGKR